MTLHREQVCLGIRDASKNKPGSHNSGIAGTGVTAVVPLLPGTHQYTCTSTPVHHQSCTETRELFFVHCFFPAPVRTFFLGSSSTEGFLSGNFAHDVKGEQQTHVHRVTYTRLYDRCT